MEKSICAYCGDIIIGKVMFGTHRDGFGEGPEVDLCEKCGLNRNPTLEEIWRKLRADREALGTVLKDMHEEPRAQPVKVTSPSYWREK